MMRALASYLMRGPLQAVLVTVVGSVLSLILLPFSHLSGAAIGLVTLRKGTKQGAIVLAGALLVTSILAMIAQGQPTYAFGFALVMWLPMLILAAVLRNVRSLPRTFMVSMLFGWIVIISTFVVLDEPGIWWYETIVSPMFEPVFEQSTVDAEQREVMQQYLKEYAEKMTGYLAVFMMYFHIFTLIIARWWQSMLYNPGGFKAEFQGLKFGKGLAYALPVLGLITIMKFGTLSIITGHFAMVVFALFVIQGLSVAHSIVDTMKKQTPWLVATYVLIFFFWHIVALAGMVDNWMDLRSFPKKKQ